MQSACVLQHVLVCAHTGCAHIVCFKLLTQNHNSQLLNYWKHGTQGEKMREIYLLIFCHKFGKMESAFLLALT